MNGENIGLFDHTFERGHFDAQFATAFCRNVRVVGNEAHVERACALCNQRSDAAKAQDAKRFAREFDAFPLAALPTPCNKCAMSLGHISCDGQNECHGVLGGGKHVGLWCVNHHHALLGGGFYVDVVETDASSRNNN